MPTCAWIRPTPHDRLHLYDSGHASSKSREVLGGLEKFPGPHGLFRRGVEAADCPFDAHCSPNESDSLRRAAVDRRLRDVIGAGVIAGRFGSTSTGRRAGMCTFTVRALRRVYFREFSSYVVDIAERSKLR